MQNKKTDLNSLTDVIVPMNDSFIQDYLSWEYPTPYDRYNIPQERRQEEYEAIRSGAEGDWYAVLDEDGEMKGFYVFRWNENGFEIGLGLRPGLTGKGLGEAFVRRGIDFGKSIRPEGTGAVVMLDVLDWNVRAAKVYERCGFVRTGVREAVNYKGPVTFIEMELR